MYRRPTFKCKDAINANVIPPPPRFANLRMQLKYYICGDESRRTQHAIIEFAISLKMRKHYLFTTHLNVGLRYIKIPALHGQDVFIIMTKCRRGKYV